MMGSAPPRRRAPSAGVVAVSRRTPSSGATTAPRSVNSAPRRSTSSRGGAGVVGVVTHRTLPASLAALPQPNTFILREDTENGVPQVVHTTFEKMGWGVYDEVVVESTSLTAVKPPTASSSTTRPPRGTSGSASRSLQGPSSSCSALSSAQSSWQTFPPYHIHWKTNRFFSSEQAACISPYMRVNHFPWSNEITLKDNLYRNIRRMKGVYGGLLYGSLHPESFTVPNEYIKFSEHFTLRYQKHLDDKRTYTEKLSEHKRLVETTKPSETSQKHEVHDAVDAPPPPPPDQPIFICKPTDMSRGRKIFLFRDLSELTYDQPSIVQSYIERPLLLEGGRKVDFRIYVLVTSYHPLTVYVYHEFLARFSAVAYDESDITNNFAHLTNYAISRTYEGGGDRPMSGQTSSSVTSVGVKWDGAATRKYFQSHFGIDFDAIVWPRIMQAVNLTLLSVVMSPSFAPTPEAGRAAAPCFELYGFDILVDAVSFQPWLVEVNYSPSLAIEMPIDVKVKTKLIEDIVGVLNVPLSPSTSNTSPTPTSHVGRPYGDFMPCFPPSVASLIDESKAPDKGPCISATPPTSSASTSEHHLNEQHLTNKCYASFPPPFIAAVEAFRAASGKQAVAEAFKDLTLEFRKVENGVKARGLKAAGQLPP